ncbi:hypothetical protein D9611_000285 [Ephemerocybe angulata]|uniref:F-box domain-containing protein n=1 Tax=Ephemerocybe angulata TaxID=980116 RepID=A0A8H5F701_9AGAR|nr:hypothetical protein D9611_000285 [Tulosesus angulatus]
MILNPPCDAMTLYSSYDNCDLNDTLIKLERRIHDLDRLGEDTYKSLDRLLQARRQKPAPSLFQRARLLLQRSPIPVISSPSRKWEVEDEEIEQTKHRIARLTLQRQETSTQLTTLRASVSAYRRVPPEIWSMIFQFCLPEDETYVRPNITTAPLLLCRVCRVWRAIATSTPRLWTSLSINRNWRKRPHHALLQQWFQRASTLPLCLEVSFTSPHKSNPHPYHDYAVLQLLLSCADRWQRLRLCTTDDFLLQAILDNPMPLLHTLEFSSNSAIGNLNIHPTFAPNLRTVTLLTAPLSLTPLSLPWNRLTQLSSRYWTDVHAHMEVMRRCPNLESIRVHILHAHSTHTPVLPPLQMPLLKTLEVVALNGSAMGLILERLSLPSLSELYLVVPEESPEYGVSGWPKALVDSLVERSSCQALKVYLDGIDVSVTGDNFLPVK